MLFLYKDISVVFFVPINYNAYAILQYSVSYRKGGLLLNNVVGITGALAMGASQGVESYELLIMGRYLIGVNCGKLGAVQKNK